MSSDEEKRKIAHEGWENAHLRASLEPVELPRRLLRRGCVP